MADRPQQPALPGEQGRPENGRAEHGRSESYGVEAELERLLRCPECGSSAVRPVPGGYGFFGLRVLGDFGSPRDVACRHCKAQWLRPPMRDLRREAERRIDERYVQFDAENERLRKELGRIGKASLPDPADEPPPTSAN